MSIARFRGPGHPDAVCDLIAAALAEAYLERDAQARTRFCVTGGRESVFVDGDLVSTADFDAAPIVRRIIAAVDPVLSFEPFLTCDAVQTEFLPYGASADPCVIIGYATAETPSRLPVAQHLGRELMRAIEQRRTQEEEGFVLGSDYDLLLDDARREATIRMEVATEEHIPQVERLLQGLVDAHLSGWRLRMAGKGILGTSGLRRRSGASGRTSSADQGSSHLPASASGIGSVVRHPANLGAWLARAAACRLVDGGKGRGVLLVFRWDPYETRPQLVSARNEHGEDLASQVDVALFDLLLPHSAFMRPGLLVEQIRADWDSVIELPWEKGQVHE